VRRNKWTAKWWTQAQAYMLGLEIPRFVWILSHRGARKYITAELDYVEAERILQSCEDAVETIRAYEAFPLDKLDAELGAPSMIVAETCRDCHFFGTACHPPLPSAESVDAVVRDDLAEDVARLVELEDAAKEHGALDRRLGKETKGKHVLAGEYLLTGEWREVHRKAQPAKPSEDVKQWKRERVKMGGET